MSPEANPGTYGQLIYNKAARVHTRVKKISSISGAGKIGQLHIQQ